MWFILIKMTNLNLKTLQGVNMLLGSCMMVDILGSGCIQVDSYASVVQRQDQFKASKAEQPYQFTQQSQTSPL